MSWISSLYPALGSWTPTIGGSGGSPAHTYTLQFGRYVKLGPIIFVKCTVVLSAKGGAITGNVQIEGLPFTSENVSGATYNTQFIWDSLATNWYNMTGFINPGTKILSIVGITAAGPSIIGANLVDADITNTTAFGFTLWYVAG
jgi:hypothetical protein